MLNVEILESLVGKSLGRSPSKPQLSCTVPQFLSIGTKQPFGAGLGSGPEPCLVWALLVSEHSVLCPPLLHDMGMIYLRRETGKQPFG